MPEGPEVRKIAQQLARRVSGRTLLSIKIQSGRYKERSPSGWDVIINALPKNIVGAGCHGKFLYCICDDEHYIWSTLGMTGNWSEQHTQHSRIKFTLNDGTIFFNDQRNFGTLKFVRGKFKLIEKLTSLGPDMLAEDVTDKKFISRLRKKNHWEITKALMDQGVIAGVGNYIKADSLWLARINPHRMVCDLEDHELSILNNSIKHIMKENFSAGDTEINAEADSKILNPEYTRRFLVYNQKMDPDGNEVVKELTQDKRTTHWCPAVQK